MGCDIVYLNREELTAYYEQYRVDSPTSVSYLIGSVLLRVHRPRGVVVVKEGEDRKRAQAESCKGV